uniref:Uncharacterized protein n=1 Tax=Plectus sambesii TaxID=2011161 RepID=A0A914VWB0_9BILA
MNRYEEEARVLTKQANQICNNVPSTSQILTILQSEETISDIDVQEIESYRTTYERVNRLIVILRTKQLDKKQVTRGIKRPFEALCFALKEMRQTWLAEELTAMLKNERTFASDPGEVEEELENEVKGASDYDARLDDAQNCVDINDNDPDLLLDTNPSEPLSSEASTGNRNTADYIQSPDIGSDEKDDSDSPIKRVDLNNTKQHKW